jgi:hypothetical protein
LVSYEYPCPARLAAHAAHLCDSSCEQAAEGAGECGGAEEDGGADAKFRALIPAAEVIIDAGEKAGFCDSEPPALHNVSLLHICVEIDLRQS